MEYRILSKEQRDAIRARCNATAPGPWITKCSKNCSKNYHSDHKIRNDRKKGQAPHEGEIEGVVGWEIAVTSGGGGSVYSNAEFIAHAKSDLPLTLDVIDAMETTEAKLSAALAALVEAEAGRREHSGGGFGNIRKRDESLVNFDAALLAARQVLAEPSTKCDVCESPLVSNGPTCADCLSEATGSVFGVGKEERHE